MASVLAYCAGLSGVWGICVARALHALRLGFENLEQVRARGLQGWTSVSRPCDDWVGVTCDASGRVIAL